MKRLAKKVNLIWVAAMIIGVMTMSFRLATKTDGQWYEVEPPSGGMQLIGDPILEPDGENCVADFPAETCAIQLTGTPPTYLHQAPGDAPKAGRTN
ncbi:hypothetical protein [Parapedobacter sp. DT-150]|uniref:hypothetical protein n=1 Tax=Parapedobacter sp. DT-150 TaxID=3396162 RepID=UPI003F1BD818